MPSPLANPSGIPSAGPFARVSATTLPGTSRKPVVIAARPRPHFRAAVCARQGTGSIQMPMTKMQIARALIDGQEAGGSQGFVGKHDAPPFVPPVVVQAPPDTA